MVLVGNRPHLGEEFFTGEVNIDASRKKGSNLGQKQDIGSIYSGKRKGGEEGSSIYKGKKGGSYLLNRGYTQRRIYCWHKGRRKISEGWGSSL